MSIPKPFKQVKHFTEIYIPKEHHTADTYNNREFWNRLMYLNSKFPNCTIYLDYYILRLDADYCAVDVKLKSHNKSQQKLLIQVYLDFYHRTPFLIPPRYKDYFSKF